MNKNVKSGLNYISKDKKATAVCTELLFMSFVFPLMMLFLSIIELFELICCEELDYTAIGADLTLLVLSLVIMFVILLWCFTLGQCKRENQAKKKKNSK